MASQALQKYRQRVEKVQSMLCVGLDSDRQKIPSHLQNEQFPQFAFNVAIIDATHQYVCAYKPNLAFYEAGGEQGLHELKLTLEYLQANYPDILTIADAKRADIGSTNDHYVTSIFDWFGFDAVTLHPYLGREALLPFLDREDKVSIILCRTSNPGSGEFQDLRVDGQPLWAKVAEQVSSSWNRNNNCMLVVGATYPQEMKEIRTIVGDEMVFLVPGIGAQGGDIKEAVVNGANSAGKGLILNVGRSVIFASGEKDFAERSKEEASQLVQAIRSQS
ncbi:orotidine-5'-phosphate decarboxylase [Patescibacteria group bacterium]|nr:orotidine-5'-phosphate decarboxylase [Patescibacteria group bacterium]